MPSLIYEPEPVFNVRENVELGIIGASTLAAIDFVAGAGKPWAYYLGTGLGTMALATGIPGAAATLYVVGDSVDFVLFNSPDGSDVRIFLNGVAHSTFDSYAAATAWEWVTGIGLVPGQLNRLDIVNYGPSPDPDASGIAWLGIGQARVNFTTDGYIQGATPMSTFNCSYSVTDSDGDSRSMVVPVPRGALTLAEITGFMEAQAALIDPILDGAITEMRVEIKVPVPGGLKASPNANAEVQKGGLFTFALDGSDYSYSIRVPALLPSLFSGKEVNTADTDVTAFVNSIIAGLDVAGTQVTPSNPFEFDINALKTAKKTFRK